MKAALLFAVLAVIASGYDAAESKANARLNLNLGNINVGDRLLGSQYVSRQAVANAVQYQDVVYRGNATTRISAIRANEIGASQNANPWIMAGGIGQNHVTVRLQTARGRGLYYRVEIYGR